jgi:hypothetical protein
MKRYTLLVALMVMLWATESLAYTIGFNSLEGNNLDRFTSHTENGYTVSATGGDWFVAKIFGNEIPAIVAGPIYHPGESQITVTEGGGQFTFQGIDLTNNVAGETSYSIAGFLGGVEVLSTSVVISSINTFETFDTSLSDSLKLVDRLTITGTPGQGTTSFNIDNIRAGAPPEDPNNIPEPASIMLLGVGLAGIEIWRRRRGLG